MGGLIAAAIYAYHAHSHEHALFRSKLFENKIYAIGILGNFFARLGGNALPFLLPLMLQVAFGFSPLITGLMMIPAVLGSLASKPIIRPIIQRFGYRRVLLVNTVLVGSLYCQSGFNHGRYAAVVANITFLYFWHVKFNAICLHEYLNAERFSSSRCQQWQQFFIHDYDAVDEYRCGFGGYAGQHFYRILRHSTDQPCIS